MPPADDAVSKLAKSALKGEAPDETLVRLHGGKTRTLEAEAQRLVDAGNTRLKAAGVGQATGRTVVPRDTDIPELDELYTALHNPSKVDAGEIIVPARLKAEYDELRRLTDWEEAARLDFDPEMATVEDYFYRGWKPPEEMLRGPSAARGPLGATPAFKKPRVGATYQEMREAGFEPLFWNPYEQWKVSRIQGIRFREQSQLIDEIKQVGLGRPHIGGPLPEPARDVIVQSVIRQSPADVYEAMGRPRSFGRPLGESLRQAPQPRQAGQGRHREGSRCRCVSTKAGKVVRVGFPANGLPHAVLCRCLAGIRG